MSQDMVAVNNAVVVSDLHVGCQYGLCGVASSVPLDGGGRYVLSAGQRKLGERWEIFWNRWVPDVTKDDPFVVVINGDMMDGRHHASTTQFSQNLADQQAALLLTLETMKKVKGYAGLYVVRGTEAHTGPAAENEERAAQVAGAIPDQEGRYARNDLWLTVGSGLCHFLHHIGTAGSNAYESSAIMRELAEEYTEAGRWARKPPQVVVRSHRHRHLEIRVPTENGYGICFCTPGWQLKTPFAWKIPGARNSTPQFGGSIIRQGDQDLYTRHIVWTIERSPAENPMVARPVEPRRPDDNDRMQ